MRFGALMERGIGLKCRFEMFVGLNVRGSNYDILKIREHDLLHAFHDRSEIKSVKLEPVTDADSYYTDGASVGSIAKVNIMMRADYKIFSVYICPDKSLMISVLPMEYKTRIEAWV